MNDPPLLRFGRHAGKPITDRSIPTVYLDWLLGNQEDGTPRIESTWFRKEVAREVAKRTGGNHVPPKDITVLPTDQIYTALSLIIRRLDRMESMLNRPPIT